MFYSYFFLVIWLCWAIYWKSQAGNSKKATKKESSFSRLQHFGALGLAGLLLLLPSVPYLDGRMLPRNGHVLFWVGAAVTLSGLIYTVWARGHLGSNWSGEVSIKEGHRLIKTGPYAITRHPMYTGLIIGFAGSAIAIDEWRGLLAVLIAILGLWRKLRKEEQWLTEEFGEEYTQYMSRVKGLIPFVL